MTPATDNLRRLLRPVENPYVVVRQPVEHAIWEALIARDSQAFAAADWSICEQDFAANRFEGISANGSFDPMRWTLRYPTLTSYRDDWLRMAAGFKVLPLSDVAHASLLYKMQRIAKIEVVGDRAVVWKQFHADEMLSTGGRYSIRSQSLYRMHHIEGRWLIVGFVGYLPLEP